MGFSRSLNAILDHLPKSRQTLLFSATQTQSIKDLARLSLKSPVSVGSNEADKEVEGWSATPKNLEQHYSIVELDKKLDVLFSFVKTHLKSKIIVFMSSCKQVSLVILQESSSFQAKVESRRVELTRFPVFVSLGPLRLRDFLQAPPRSPSPRASRKAKTDQAP